MSEEEQEHLEKLLQFQQQRLRILEQQAAQSGLQTSPQIILEINDLRAQIIKREKQLTSSLSSPYTPPIPSCPYPGMAPFTGDDARFFHGRDDEIQRMLEHLRHHRSLLLIGPSGSGKSSLVSAGLLPRLLTSAYFKSGYWLIHSLRPGKDPFCTLLEMLGGNPIQDTQTVHNLLEGHPPAQRLLLIIDQFEEVFTQAPRTEQQALITSLKLLASMEETVLVILMRADFYGDLLNSDLLPLSRCRQMNITPLRGKSLRRAIQKPALDVGIKVEAGLLERLVTEAADEPGVLPLIQETMVLLWDLMENHSLTLDSYIRLGTERYSGIATALVTKADTTFEDLSPEQQIIARRIFVRLVQFGEGRADTRRQQTVVSLRADGDDPLVFEQTLRRLEVSRLLTMDSAADGTRRVDMAHEALIMSWPMLQEWLKQQREAEQQRRRLDMLAEEWFHGGCNESGLLDEKMLEKVENWFSGPDPGSVGFSELLRFLVKASRERFEQSSKKLRERLKEADNLHKELESVIQGTGDFVDASFDANMEYILNIAAQKLVSDDIYGIILSLKLDETLKHLSITRDGALDCSWVTNIVHNVLEQDQELFLTASEICSWTPHFHLIHCRSLPIDILKGTLTILGIEFRFLLEPQIIALSNIAGGHIGRAIESSYLRSQQYRQQSAIIIPNNGAETRVSELERVANDLRPRMRGLYTLEEGLRVITSTLSLDEVLDQIVDSTVQMLGSVRVHGMALSLEEEQGFTHRLFTPDGSTSGTWAELLAQRVRHQQVPQIISDIAIEADLDALMPKGLRSALCVPLFVGDGAPRGALTVVSSAVAAFSSTDARHLTALASQARIAIQNVEMHWRLRSQQQLLEAVVRDINGGLVVIDAQSRVVLTNPIGQYLLNKTTTTVPVHGQLMSLAATMRAENKATLMCELRLAGEEDDVESVYQALASQVRYDDSEEPLIAIVLHDITAQKVEERTRTEFISMVSHELRNPLNSLNGFIKVILQGRAGALTPLQHEFLEIADSQTVQLKDRIAELLEFNRLETGRLVLNPQWNNLLQLITHAVTRLSLQAEQTGLTLINDLPVELPECFFDSERIGQVLTNLIENAIKATPPGGRITLRAELHENEVWVRVADTGVGIPAEEQSKIFQRFYRAHNRASSYGNHLGLGLAICQQIIEGHSGRMWVESEEGQGSCFTFALPFSQDRAPDET